MIRPRARARMMSPPRPPRGFQEAVPTILPTLADVRPRSVVRTLAEALAKEVAAVHKQLNAVYKDSFVETANAADLDALVTLLRYHRRRIDSLYAEAEGAVLALGKKKPKKKTAKKKAKKASAKRRLT